MNPVQSENECAGGQMTNTNHLVHVQYAKHKVFFFPDFIHNYSHVAFYNMMLLGIAIMCAVEGP